MKRTYAAEFVVIGVSKRINGAFNLQCAAQGNLCFLQGLQRSLCLSPDCPDFFPNLRQLFS